MKIVNALWFCLTSSTILAMENSNAAVITSIMKHDLSKIRIRHQKELKLSDVQAHTHEKELKRFLSICAIYGPGTGMFSEKVDNMWHNFILFTSDYTKFCKEHTGKFIHHEPTTEDVDKKQTAQLAREFIKRYHGLFSENPPKEIWGLENAPCLSLNTADANCKTNCNNCAQCSFACKGFCMTSDAPSTEKHTEIK